VSARILACGDSALTVELGSTIDAATHDRVIALEAILARAGPPVVETVPSYCSLLVHYDAAAVTFSELSARIRSLSEQLPAARTEGRLWEFPVVYGGQFGIDLQAVAYRHGMSAEEVVARHSRATYRVYMIGFVPGFSYLGGLDPALATPRLDTPRRATPAGSISIGGMQAAVGSLPAPSGWHLVGRTPARTFMAGRDPVCLLAPGDHVTFRPIEPDGWQPLALAAQTGAPVARIVG
jgi:KipI family sensor histidine kinase inhibitor